MERNKTFTDLDMLVNTRILFQIMAFLALISTGMILAFKSTAIWFYIIPVAIAFYCIKVWQKAVLFEHTAAYRNSAWMIATSTFLSVGLATHFVGGPIPGLFITIMALFPCLASCKVICNFVGPIMLEIDEEINVRHVRPQDLRPQRPQRKQTTKSQND